MFLEIDSSQPSTLAAADQKKREQPKKSAKLFSRFVKFLLQNNCFYYFGSSSITGWKEPTFKKSGSIGILIVQNI